MADSFVLEDGDKVTPVALYTATTLFVGKLVTKEMVRVSTWLRTPGLPDFGTVYDATVHRFAGPGDPVVSTESELHVPVAQVIAMHVAPPETDKPEFDPSETNRKFEPVSAMAGPFRFDGTLRMPQHLTLARQMALLREPFTMLYDVKISPEVKLLGDMSSTMVLVRPGAFQFASRPAA